MRMQKRTGALLIPLLLLAAGNVSAVTPAARDEQDSRISVTAVAGQVDVTMAGQRASVRPDTTVILPARVVTGGDGTLGLTQAGTNISVANDTDVEIPAEAVDGNLVARLVQHRGNVFYDVAKRDVGKLRVETPLLVAVIKGTQFNVAVLEDSTTISLFEGRLEIRTPDNAEVIELNAGEIAIRSRADDRIRVLGMNDERVAAPRADAAAARLALRDAASPEALALAGTGPARDASVDVAVGDKPDAGTVANALAGVRTGAEGGQAPARIDLDLGGATASLGTNVGLGAGGAAVSAGATLDLGVAGVNVALESGVDLRAGEVAVALGAGADLGAASVDLALDAGVDVASGSVDLGLDTGVDLGAASADLTLDTDVDLVPGSVAAGLDAGLDLGGAVVVDLGLDAGLDLDPADAGVDVGLDLGGALDIGLDVDLDSGTLDLSLGQTQDSTAPAPAPPPPPPRRLLGGLLGGLL